jgi:hypothetical protein
MFLLAANSHGQEYFMHPLYACRCLTYYNPILKQNVIKLNRYSNSRSEGRAIAQVVSRRSLTAEARVRAPVNPCGVCGGQSGTGTGFSPSSSGFPCQYIIPPSLSKLISSGECVIC